MIAAMLAFSVYFGIGAWFVALTLPANIEIRQQQGPFDPTHLLPLAILTALTWPQHLRFILMCSRLGIWFVTGPLSFWRRGWTWIIRNGAPHTIPYGDRRGHRLTVDCSCRPVSKEGVIAHNAWDGRQ